MDDLKTEILRRGRKIRDEILERSTESENQAFLNSTLVEA